MQYNNTHHTLDLNQHAPCITYNNTIRVGYYHTNHTLNTPIPQHEAQLKYKTLPSPKSIALLTTKKTYAEAVRTMDDDGDYYTKPRKLDSGATGNFDGTQTGILDRTTVTNGFDVMVANGERITQQAAGRVPFNVPDTAASVDAFQS